MIISFYDKDFKALQNNASLNTDKWTLKRKAVDMDDFSATCEPFIENVNPTFVVLADDRGRYKYGAFAGVPQLNKENKTEIQATDLKNIFKNDIFIKFAERTTSDTVKDVFEEVVSTFESQVLQNSFDIECDFDDAGDVHLQSIFPDSSKYQSIDVWEDIFCPYLKFYDLYMESKVDLPNKKLIFEVHKIKQTVKALRLYEFTNKNFSKWISSLNEAQFVVLTSTNIIYGTPYILLSDNSITSNLAQRDLYPIKKKYIIKESDGTQADILAKSIEGLSECVQELADARYNESIEIKVNDTPYENDDFSISYQTYSSRGVFYKTLPIGSIEEGSDGAKKISIGYKDDDLVIYI